MDVFLDLVVIGRFDTLDQICKVDKTNSGKQLSSLLSMITIPNASMSRGMDELRNESREGGISNNSNDDGKAERTKLSKNAYALMRLGRYKHAAAVFLCANPPFLKVRYHVISYHIIYVYLQSCIYKHISDLFHTLYHITYFLFSLSTLCRRLYLYYHSN